MQVSYILSDFISTYSINYWDRDVEISDYHWDMSIIFIYHSTKLYLMEWKNLY